MQDHVFVTNIVHDEINLEVKEIYAEAARSALEDAMEEAGARWCKTIPLAAEGVIAEYWTH